MCLKIAVVHQDVPPDAPADERDVLHEAAAVSAALIAAGHDVRTVPCDLNLQALLDHPAVRDADVVFNLVESLAGSGRLIHLPPTVLEVAGIPFTGNSSEAQFLSSGKLPSKRLLHAAGLPTAPWVDPQTIEPAAGAVTDWIVKSAWEHASVGLDDNSVLRGVTAAEAAAAAAARGHGWFAEQFLDGREFNVALLQMADGVLRVLPPAELVFVDYPPQKPRIVGYDAKWHEKTFECGHTVRRFIDPVAEPDLCADLEMLARACWQLFSLAGYARVDFRADAAGEVSILEINANPCIAPDAGFAAALAAGGIAYADAVCGLVTAAYRQHGHSPLTLSSPGRANRPGEPLPPPLPHTAAAAPSLRGGEEESDRCATVAPLASASPSDFHFRYDVQTADAAVVRRIVSATGFFSEEEVGVAQELVDERIAKEEASGYLFVFAERAGTVVGYSCYGPIPCTRSSFDLYWIVVDPAAQGSGLGRALLHETEASVRQRGGTRLYAETSGRAQYASTRGFYERTGFDRAEVLEDFYDVGDARITYCKVLV